MVILEKNIMVVTTTMTTTTTTTRGHTLEQVVDTKRKCDLEMMRPNPVMRPNPAGGRKLQS